MQSMSVCCGNVLRKNRTMQRCGPTEISVKYVCECTSEQGNKGAMEPFIVPRACYEVGDVRARGSLERWKGLWATLPQRVRKKGHP